MFLHGTNPKMCWNQASAKRNQGLSRLLYIIFHYAGMDRKVHGNPPVFRPDLLPRLYSFRILRRGRSFLVAQTCLFAPFNFISARSASSTPFFPFFSNSSQLLLPTVCVLMFVRAHLPIYSFPRLVCSSAHPFPFTPSHGLCVRYSM